MRTRIPSILLGCLVGFLAAFGLGARPGAPLVLVPDCGRALDALTIHYVPEFGDEVEETYVDLVRALGSDVEIHVIVEESGDYEDLLGRMSGVGVSTGRFRPVVTGFPVSPWSKDRYGTFEKDGRPVLAVPADRAPMPGRRGNDERVPALFAGSTDRFGLEVLPFRFEGGDLLSDGKRLYLPANLPSRDQPENDDDLERTVSRIRSVTGLPVIRLGTRPEDIPDHHVGMYLTPIGHGRVVMGDPDMGRAAVTRLGIQLDVMDDGPTYERFRRAIRDVDDAGIEVIRIPLILTTSDRVYVTYNNAIVDMNDGGPCIHMPVYGLPRLDAMAKEIFESAGVKVNPVRVGRVYRHTGSLRCLVGVLSRRP